MLKAAKNDSFKAVLTVIEKTQLKWVEFSTDSENVAPCTEFLKLLEFHARHLVSVSYTGHKQTSGSDQKLPVTTILCIIHGSYMPSM